MIVQSLGAAHNPTICAYLYSAALYIHTWQLCRAFQNSQSWSLIIVRSVPCETKVPALKWDPEQVRCSGRGRDKRIHRTKTGHRTKGYRTTILRGTTTAVCSALRLPSGGWWLLPVLERGGLGSSLPCVCVVFGGCYIYFCASVPFSPRFPSLGVVNIYSSS